jgi:hypothetical protein
MLRAKCEYEKKGDQIADAYILDKLVEAVLITYSNDTLVKLGMWEIFTSRKEVLETWVLGELIIYDKNLLISLYIIVEREPLVSITLPHWSTPFFFPPLDLICSKQINFIQAF